LSDREDLGDKRSILLFSLSSYVCKGVVVREIRDNLVEEEKVKRKD